MALGVRLLGRFELTESSGGGRFVPGTRAQLLIARLALAKGMWQDRAVLAALLWADRAEPQARASLRQAIFSLRQGLPTGPDVLQSEGEMLRLDPQAMDCDVITFDRLALSSDPADLEVALGLCGGDLLEGADLVLLDPDGFFQAQRQRLRDLALQVATTLVAAHATGGRWDDVVRVARHGLVQDPYAETLNAALVQALQALGRPGDARDQDAAFRRVMANDLGLTLPPLPQAARRTIDPAPPAVPQPGPPEPPGPPGPPRRDLGRLAVAVGAVALIAGVGLWQMTVPRPTAAGGQAVPAVSALPTTSLQAYDLYLRAESQRLAARGDSKLRAVIALYQRALTLDPDFTAAHAGLALAAVTLAQRRFEALLPPDEARDQAYAAAGLALQRDPENARALIVLSRLQAMDGAREMALISAKRAVLAAPGDAEARANLALLLSRDGQAFQARSELARLRQLDPVPRAEGMLIYGEIAFAQGRFDAAIADMVAAWPDLPQDQVLLTHLTAALAIQGQLVQAQRVLQDLRATLPEANLYQMFSHYAPLRSAVQNQRLLDGLRRAGLPVWAPGAGLAPEDRLTGPALAALIGRVPGSPNQYLRGEELCRIENGHSVCGSIYHAPPGRGVDYVFLAPTEIRFFSDPTK